jgi:hypothetical protein
MGPCRRDAWRTGLTIGLVVAAVAPGCSTIGNRGEALVPTRSLTRMGPYRIWTHEPPRAQEPMLRPLGDLERQLQSQLAVHVDPDESPIDIYILKDRAAFEQFLKFYYPELPSRRAFFLAQGNRRLVYTYEGEHLTEDLRHEVTHALLHASVANLPLWLDEGLAEYFEVGGESGLNREHLGRIGTDLAGGWRPDLVRLERLTDVRQMTARDYREAWAWTHYLLRGEPQEKAAMLSYLADLRSSSDAAPLSARLRLDARDGGERLIAHVTQTRERAVAATVSPSSATRPLVVRGQDAAVEPPRPAPRRRTVFSRFLDLFGF